MFRTLKKHLRPKFLNLILAINVFKYFYTRKIPFTDAKMAKLASEVVFRAMYIKRIKK